MPYETTECDTNVIVATAAFKTLLEQLLDPGLTDLGPRTTEPTSLTTGQFWLRTDLGRVHLRLGSSTLAIALADSGAENTVVANPAPVDPAQSWSSDFEEEADGTLLRNIIGWRAVDALAPGWEQGDDDSLRIVGGKLVSTSVDPGISGKRLFLRDVGVETQTIRLEGVNFNKNGTEFNDGVPSVVFGADGTTAKGLIVNVSMRYGIFFFSTRDDDGSEIGELQTGAFGQPVDPELLYDIEYRFDPEANIISTVWRLAGSTSAIFTKTWGMDNEFEPGTYGGLSTGTSSNVAIDGFSIGGDAFYPPLTLAAGSVDGFTKKAYASIHYWEDEPAQFEMRVMAGSILVADWAIAAVSENDVPGYARLDSLVAIPEIYKGIDLTLEIRKDGSTTVQRIAAYYSGAALTIGQNANSYGGIQAGYAVVRAYQNMAVGGLWQDSRPGGDWEVILPSTPGVLDADGMPLVSGLHLVMCGPDPDGTAKTIEVTWTGGPASFNSITSDHPTAHASLLAANSEFVNGSNNLNIAGTNSIQFTYTPSSDLVDDRAYNNQLGFYVEFSGAAPMNIQVHLVGEDKSLRFAPSYLTLMSQMRGPIRHMDSLYVNNANAQDAFGFEWSKRSRRSMIGLAAHPLGIPFEDMAELCWLTERPLHWTIPLACAYHGVEGLDYVRKGGALMYAGTDSDIARNLGQKNLTTYAEVCNEIWNWGFDAPHMLDAKGKAAGRIPANETNWWGRQAEHNYVHNLIMPVVKEVIPEDHRQCLLGAQFAAGPAYITDGMMTPGSGQYDPTLTDPSGLSLWSQEHVDAVSYACYVGGDPNAAESAAFQPNSHSPADIAQWAVQSFELVAPKILTWNAYLRANGMKANQYEFGFSLGQIELLTATEERAFRSSASCKTAIRYVYNRLSEISDGAVCIYSDYGITGNRVWREDLDPQQWTSDFNRWGHMVARNGPNNQMWEALTEWQAAQLAA